MKKILKFLLIIIILLSIITLYYFSYYKKEEKNINNIKENNVQVPTLEDNINIKLSSMTIEQKIAQMIILNYNNNIVDNKLLNYLKNNTPGGFILMKNNITSYNQTKKFVSDIINNSSITPIISIDQEGGNVQRLKYLNDVEPTDIPYMYDLGKTNNKELAYKVGKVMGEELKTIGINVVFAPDIDVYSNKNNTVIGKRSFSEDYNIVSSMANNLANGIESTGIIPTYKHFPGHGDTETDSHYDLPIINKTYDQLKELELKTFKNAINNNAKIIMIGHIALPNITNDNIPASLSKKIITEILKNDLKYDGLVITDALNMEALRNYYKEEICVKAIEAGVDLLLMPDDFNNTINYIKNNISEERINQSVKKILMFKYIYLTNNTFLDKEYLGSNEHQNIINNIHN